MKFGNLEFIDLRDGSTGLLTLPLRETSGVEQTCLSGKEIATRKAMKSIHLIALFTLASLGLGQAANTSWGGATTTDVDNWVTSGVAFDDAVQSGHSLNWENVTTNTAVTNSGANQWDMEFVAGAPTNYTIGHMFIYNQSFDLSTSVGGLEALTMTADFNASSFANWSPVVAITNGGATTYYRWNHSGNSFNGNAIIDFSFTGANTFDLSQNGNGTGTRVGVTGIWGELNSAATGFGGTRDNGTNPNLQATSGSFQVGFLQWGASTGGSANSTFTTALDSFETSFDYTPIPEPSTAALFSLAGLLILRRRR